MQRTTSCSAADPTAPAQASACQEQQHAQLLTQAVQPNIASAAQNAHDFLPGQDPVRNVPPTADTAMHETCETTGQSALRYGKISLGPTAAVNPITEPCSQLLEDTPMELWECDGVADPDCEVEGIFVSNEHAQPHAQESAEALRQLEDFARCMNMPSSPLSIVSCVHRTVQIATCTEWSCTSSCLGHLPISSSSWLVCVTLPFTANHQHPCRLLLPYGQHLCMHFVSCFQHDMSWALKCRPTVLSAHCETGLQQFGAQRHLLADILHPSYHDQQPMS